VRGWLTKWIHRNEGLVDSEVTGTENDAGVRRCECVDGVVRSPASRSR